MYKFLGEEVCKLYKQSFSVDAEIARFYNVYGPNETLDEVHGNVIGIWQTKIKKTTSTYCWRWKSKKRLYTCI